MVEIMVTEAASWITVAGGQGEVLVSASLPFWSHRGGAERFCFQDAIGLVEWHMGVAGNVLCGAARCGVGRGGAGRGEAGRGGTTSEAPICAYTMAPVCLGPSWRVAERGHGMACHFDAWHCVGAECTQPTQPHSAPLSTQPTQPHSAPTQPTWADARRGCRNLVSHGCFQAHLRCC